jgi:RNA polymerase sigma-70 factor (ECF subfamily)
MAAGGRTQTGDSKLVRTVAGTRQRKYSSAGTFCSDEPSEKQASVVNTDDRRLIADCLAGRTSAFGELVRRYQDRLFNAVLRVVDNAEDAADVVQDAFLNAYQSLNSFKGDSEFFTWLYRIAFNAAISLRRKRKVVLSFDGDERTATEPTDPSEFTQPGIALERSEEDAHLLAAMARLSPEHRAVLVLKDLEGQKYEDIAAVLDVPIGTIRSRLHRARMELKDLLHRPE